MTRLGALPNNGNCSGRVSRAGWNRPDAAAPAREFPREAEKQQPDQIRLVDASRLK